MKRSNQYEILGRSGVQLVELIVAMAILAVIFLFVLNLLPLSQLAVHTTNEQLSAETLAHSVLEELRGGGIGTLAVGETRLEPTQIGNTEFERRYVVSDVPNADSELVKMVMVTIQWQRDSETKVFELDSYISGLQRF